MQRSTHLDCVKNITTSANKAVNFIIRWTLTERWQAVNFAYNGSGIAVRWHLEVET